MFYFKICVELSYDILLQRMLEVSAMDFTANTNFYYKFDATVLLVK
jgi:hypothetical protein